MKKITYTQMRNELSATLDDMRAGESVIVTQRGKPDIIIKAISQAEMGDKIPIDTPESTQVEDYSDVPAFKPDLVAVAKSRKIVNALKPKGEAMRVMNAVKKVSEQFGAMLESEEIKRVRAWGEEVRFRTGNLSHEEEIERAIEYTRYKYADIIKSLEDK